MSSRSWHAPCARKGHGPGLRPGATIQIPSVWRCYIHGTRSQPCPDVYTGIERVGRRPLLLPSHVAPPSCVDCCCAAYPFQISIASRSAGHSSCVVAYRYKRSRSASNLLSPVNRAWAARAHSVARIPAASQLKSPKK